MSATENPVNFKVVG